MFITTELLFKTLLYVFGSVTFIQILYFLFFYFRVIFWKSKKTETVNIQPVSIIIAARNEAENLKKNLPYFLEQDYPDFRVIVVNDASTDDSETILAELKLKYKNLYVTNIPFDEKFRHGKKTALTIGIKAAETDILLFSDADCKPAGKNWVKSISQNFDEKKQFVIGFGGYEKSKGLINKFVRNDTVFIALTYLGFALAKMPYMGVGRNMAYRKSYFLEKKGFARQMNLLSGSDDLFINQNATRRNLSVELSNESFTFSETKKTFKQWKNQKSRHLTTGKYYKFKHKFLLFLEPFSRLIYYALGIFLMSVNQYLVIVSSIFVFRFLFFCFILYKSNKKFEQKGLFISGIFFDILQPFFNLYFSLFARKKNELIWK
ncbi:MAG: glycosyltransferase [Bacteroidales bacterium]|nr:glycosyltransferase [Bacteroidales bacterium]